MFVFRWLSLTLILSGFTACEKPTPAKHDSATATAVEPQPVARKKAGMDEAGQIASLIDPGKLATLKSRGANTRILKITAILWSAKYAGKNPAEITLEAVKKIGWSGTPAGDLTATAILRNLEILEELGATTPADIAEMRRGRSPTVRQGPSTGDILSVDHIIPVAKAPELSNCIANLELMPLRLNQRKNDTIGDTQRDLAQKLYAAGLLSSSDLPK
jgi:hypothetical protein